MLERSQRLTTARRRKGTQITTHLSKKLHWKCSILYSSRWLLARDLRSTHRTWFLLSFDTTWLPTGEQRHGRLIVYARGKYYTGAMKYTRAGGSIRGWWEDGKHGRRRLISCSCWDEAGICWKSDFTTSIAHRTHGYCSGCRAWISMALPAEIVEGGWNRTGGIWHLHLIFPPQFNSMQQ